MLFYLHYFLVGLSNSFQRLSLLCIAVVSRKALRDIEHWVSRIIELHISQKILEACVFIILYKVVLLLVQMSRWIGCGVGHSDMSSGFWVGHGFDSSSGSGNLACSSQKAPCAIVLFSDHMANFEDFTRQVGYIQLGILLLLIRLLRVPSLFHIDVLLRNVGIPLIVLFFFVG